MNTSTLVKVFATVFLLIGVLGFVPGITTDGHLLGIFQVDMMHNIIHLLTGILGFVFAKSAPKMFLKVFGVVYLLVTIMGFLEGNTVLGLMGVNLADNVLHLLASVVALVFGFKKEGIMASMPSMSATQ